MKNTTIKILKLDETTRWGVQVGDDTGPWSAGQPRFEIRGEVARLVVEMPEYIARVLADSVGGLPFYPAPLDVTEQLGHAVRELANAAGEMSAAAKALREPTVTVTGIVEEGPPVGFCNFQDHHTLGAHMRQSSCSDWRYAYRERR